MTPPKSDSDSFEIEYQYYSEEEKEIDERPTVRFGAQDGPVDILEEFKDLIQEQKIQPNYMSNTKSSRIKYGKQTEVDGMAETNGRQNGK